MVTIFISNFMARRTMSFNIIIQGKKNIASIGTVITDTHIDAKPSEITASELKLRPMKQCNFKHRSDYHTLKVIIPKFYPKIPIIMYLNT